MMCDTHCRYLVRVRIKKKQTFQKSARVILKCANFDLFDLGSASKTEHQMSKILIFGFLFFRNNFYKIPKIAVLGKSEKKEVSKMYSFTLPFRFRVIIKFSKDGDLTITLEPI